MASVLNTTITLEGDHFLITGSLATGGTLPQAIFIYENTGTTSLGDFYGTCNLQELGRLQVYSSSQAIGTFGNKYLRHDQIKIKVPLEDDPVSVIAALVQNVKLLSTAYGAQTTVVAAYQIP